MKTQMRKTEQDAGIERSQDLRLLTLYRACHANAGELLHEAEVLFNRSRFARALFLALTAYEELGKAQIVADYYSGCVSRAEFDAAFHDHKTKLAFNDRCLSVPPGELVYDPASAADLWRERQESLYVHLGQDHTPVIPGIRVTENQAREMINNVKDIFGAILGSEWLNAPHVGSKALFK